MAASKLDEVGQMRSRRGTSMKRITKEHTLAGSSSVRGCWADRWRRVGQKVGKLTDR